MKKNDELSARIEGTTSDGLGVARAEGRAIFVKGAAEGELCRIGITKVSSSAVYGRLIEILEPSPERVTPDCPYYGRCGGCDFRHISYAEECRLKARRVADALTRIGGLQVTSVPLLGAPDIEGYRNKAVYPVRAVGGAPQAGFFRARTHELIPVEHCRIQNAAADAARAALLDWMARYRISAYDERAHTGYVRALFVRTADATGQVLVCVVANTEKLPRARELARIMQAALPGLTTLVHGVHTRPGNAVLGERFHTLLGPGYIEDVLCGLRFRLSPRSFYQVNRAQAERLYEQAVAAAQLNGRETVLDLYCGTGTITLCLARHAARAIGVELVPEAIEDARQNALRNGIANAEFFCADAGEAAQRFAREGVHPDVIVVDPPRKGLSPDAVAAIGLLAPERLVYVSCDPATLARDAARLTQLGFSAQQPVCVDLFPRCAHVETVLSMLKIQE